MDTNLTALETEMCLSLDDFITKISMSFILRSKKIE